MIDIKDIEQDLIDYANSQEREWWERYGKKKYEEYKANPGGHRYYSWSRPKSQPEEYNTLEDALSSGVASFLENTTDRTINGHTYTTENVTGGEDQGSYYRIVFLVDGELFAVEGSYDSEDGVSWWGAEIHRVVAETRTITVYERV